MENKLEKIGQNTDFTESDFEKSIPSNSQGFLIELGKGYIFVARRQHIHMKKRDYYIDLAFDIILPNRRDVL